MPEASAAPALPPPRPPRKHRVQVYVSHDVTERLGRLAEERGETVSYVAALLLEAALPAREAGA